MFKTTYKETEKTIDVFFDGRMDGLAVKEIDSPLQEKLASISEGCKDIKVVFDLSKVEYIASAFIRICVATAKELGDGNFSIINTNPLIKKTFKVAGLETVLNVS